MDIGLSSACFYPLETEKSIVRAGETGTKTIEIFMNADSEFEPAFVKNMADICKSYGMRVSSVHTMGSFTESYHLFSSYKRRFFEAKDTSFKRHFDVMHTLGAKHLVLHGIKKPGSISDEEYFDRFGELILMGKAEDLLVCQENVVHYRSESPDFLSRMGEYIGDDFNMVFDIKQSLRTGINPYEFAEKLHKYIPDCVGVTDETKAMHGRVLCMPAFLSKGLEFDSVVIPYAENYDDNDRLMYLFSTRALHELNILYSP